MQLLCNSVLVSAVQEWINYTCVAPSLSSLPPGHPPTSRSPQGHELSFLPCISFPLVCCFTHGGGPVSALLSQFAPASPLQSIPFKIHPSSHHDFILNERNVMLWNYLRRVCLAISATILWEFAQSQWMKCVSTLYIYMY